MTIIANTQAAQDNVWLCRIGGPCNLSDIGNEVLTAAVIDMYLETFGKPPRGVFASLSNWTDLEAKMLLEDANEDTSPCSDELRAQFEAHGNRFREIMDETDVTWPVLMYPVFGTDGSYVTDAKTGANHLRMLAAHGVWKPLKHSAHETTWESGYIAASVGKATLGEHAGKWMGWSHRAIVAFGIGDMLFDPALLRADRTDSNPWSKVPFTQIGTVSITTDEQAREAAEAFADYIG